MPALKDHIKDRVLTEYPEQNYHVPLSFTPGSYVGKLKKDISINPKQSNNEQQQQQQQEDIPLLFQPFTVKDLTLPNRIVVAPMCMDSSEGGFMSDFHLVHLGSYALGGAGLIIAEATAVEDRGRITPGDLGIWKDEQIPGLKRVVDFVHAHNGKIGIQLAHAGRKWDQNHHVPRELTVQEIREIVEAFGQAAIRAAKAGMDTVEIHGAHGYLIHSFLSPVTNHRTDQYGGSLENRARFLLEVIKEVRDNFPAEKPILLRVSATDYVEHLNKPSWEIEQTVQIAKWVKEAGVDVFHVSSGGNTKDQKINAFPGYQVPFAERIKQEVPGLYVIAVGLIVDGQQAEKVLQEEKADLVAAGRAFLRDPSFTLQAARQLNVKAKHIKQYAVVENQ
ncbi:hypothetical protein BG004_006002 [Podila humilis]|nr:hypothetical protein BG004_006002 [Podila humilis]